MTEPLRELIASYIRHWGPESPDEPGAADRLADIIIQEVLDAHRVTRPTLAPARGILVALLLSVLVYGLMGLALWLVIP